MSEQDYVPLPIWQEQNRKEAQWIRELQDRVSRLESEQRAGLMNQNYVPERIAQMVKLLDMIVEARSLGELAEIRGEVARFLYPFSKSTELEREAPRDE